MQYIRFYRGEGVVWGRVEGERVKALTGAPYLDGAETGEVFPLSELTLAAPCEPTKIVAIGKNYYDHAVEMGEGVPETPALFFKTTNCICDPEAEIPYPAHLTERLDYEGEIAVVIGKKASRLTKENAMDAVFGYTILNDVTARDVQKREIQWTRGKAIDNGAPVGPWIVTGIDASDLRITTRLNGEVRQDSRTSKLMHGYAELLAFITEAITLYPGDLVTTGTPAGIGSMAPGDVVEVEIEQIGVLRNKIV